MRGGQANGNIEFNNDGFLQAAYNNGKPVQFWFAAITLDNFANDTIFEKNAAGVAGHVSQSTKTLHSPWYISMPWP
ncbi:MAG: hypothetical protein IPO69_17970 [Saprospiraceae bacterium]|nr:hypothetical protein [Saprospiraceae bacterium]